MISIPFVKNKQNLSQIEQLDNKNQKWINKIKTAGLLGLLGIGVTYIASRWGEDPCSISHIKDLSRANPPLPQSFPLLRQCPQLDYSKLIEQDPAVKNNLCPIFLSHLTASNDHPQLASTLEACSDRVDPLSIFDPIRERSYEILFQSFLDDEEWKKAIEITEKMGKDKSYCLSKLIAQCPNVDIKLNAAELLNDATLQVESYAAIIEDLMIDERWEDAIVVAQKAKENITQARLLLPIVQNCQDTEKRVAIAEIMAKKIRTDFKTLDAAYDAIISDLIATAHTQKHWSDILSIVSKRFRKDFQWTYLNKIILDCPCLDVRLSAVNAQSFSDRDECYKRIIFDLARQAKTVQDWEQILSISKKMYTQWNTDSVLSILIGECPWQAMRLKFMEAIQSYLKKEEVREQAMRSDDIVIEDQAPIDFDRFHAMPDLERVTHPELDPKNAAHARVILTPQGEVFDPNQIKRFKRTLMLKFHPDKAPGLLEATAWYRINIALNTLCSNSQC